MDSVVFSIGICDDDTKWHKAVSESCSRFFDNKEIEFEISSYYRGNDLIQDNSKEIDILFLDVEMDSMDGLAVMKEAEKMSNIHNIVLCPAIRRRYGIPLDIKQRDLSQSLLPMMISLNI